VTARKKKKEKKMWDRANQRRAFNVIQSIATKHTLTVNQVLVAFEKLFGDESDANIVKSFDGIVNEMIPEKATAQDLIKEMSDAKPIKVENIQVNIKSGSADAKVQKMLAEKEDERNKALEEDRAKKKTAQNLLDKMMDEKTPVGQE